MSAAVEAARVGPAATAAPAPAPAAPAHGRQPILEHLLRRPVPAWDDTTGPVSRDLAARIPAEAIARLDARLDGSAREIWDLSGPEARDRLSLLFGAFYGNEQILTATGLRSVTPPDDVHAMARGPLAAGGDPAIADIVAGCFADAGLELPDGGCVLDFGASSGRVVRVLQAWRPAVRWVGCDPNADAIAWAAEHLPDVRFFASPQRPPLPLGDGELDAAFAISIWSHFAVDPALGWLDEMHRVIRPGGMLLLTTHGWDTLAQLVRRDLMTRDSAEEAAQGMLATGHHFFDVFGEDGDWGVRDAGWGNAFLTLDWLAGVTAGRWTVRLFRPARLDHNQDLVILERRD